MENSVRMCILFFTVLIFISSCSKSVKIIRNENKFYEKTLNLAPLDKAEIKLPFVPSKIKIFSSEILRVDRENDTLFVKALFEGKAKIFLLDEDDIRIGIINIFIKE